MMKKTWKKSCMFFAAAAVILTLAACTNIEFTQAEKLPPLPEDTRMGVFYDPAKLPLPVEKLKKAGSIVAVSSSSGNTINDLRNRIIEEAKEHGANIVLFTSVEYTQAGDARSDQIRNVAAPGWDRVDNTQSNVRQEWNTFQYSDAKENYQTIYKVTMKADLYFAPLNVLKPRNVPVRRKPVLPETDDRELRFKIRTTDEKTPEE